MSMSSTNSGNDIMFIVSVRTLGYCNMQSLMTSVALMTTKTAECTLFLHHQYVKYSQFKSGSYFKWLVRDCHSGIILQNAYVYVNYNILYIFLTLMLVHIYFDYSFDQNSAFMLINTCIHATLN